MMQETQSAVDGGHRLPILFFLGELAPDIRFGQLIANRAMGLHANAALFSAPGGYIRLQPLGNAWRAETKSGCMRRGSRRRSRDQRVPFVFFMGVFELWHLYRGGGCMHDKMDEGMTLLMLELAGLLRTGHRSRDCKLARFCQASGCGVSGV